MRFKNRTEAGKLLAKKLKRYKKEEVVVYALPRGGVVTAIEIARYLRAPLDLIITRKIGHPYQPEYAIAATAENGHIVGSQSELNAIDKVWLKEAIKKQRKEAVRRREVYLKDKKPISCGDKIAILVDDGVATGLTLRVGIMELRHRHPKRIVVAVPIVPKLTATLLKKEADDVVALGIPEENEFLGAVGAYYDHFSQVTDNEVVAILQSYERKLKLP